MLRRYFNNYKGFTCIADACPTNCCGGWIIDIDKDSLERYRTYRGHDYEILQERVDFENSVTKRKPNGDCAFLREDGLCQMQRSLGEDFLCVTCDMFPRHIEEFRGVREYSLSAACPVIAMQFVTDTNPLSFEEETDDIPENDEEYLDFNDVLYEKLLHCRKNMVEILQNRNVDFVTRCNIMLKMIAGVQEDIDMEMWDDCDAYIDEYLDENGEGVDSEDIIFSWDNPTEYFEFLHKLKPMNENFKAWVKTAQSFLFNNGLVELEKNVAEFDAYEKDWQIWCEQISVYFVYTYFCGSVYDNFILALAKEAVYNAFMIKLLWVAKWIECDKSITKEQMAEIVYRYSREIENEDQNLFSLEEMLDEQ